MELAEGSGDGGTAAAAEAGRPTEAPVHAPLRVRASTMPVAAITDMDGVPVRLDAGIVAVRPSWWDRLWTRVLSSAVPPSSPGGKVSL